MTTLEETIPVDEEGAMLLPKNGKRIIAQKCKAGSSKQQWQIGPM